MKQENLGPGLVCFLIYAFFGFATEAFQALLGIVASAAVLAGEIPAEAAAAVNELLLAGISAVATMFGIVLVIRRSPTAPAFWSVMLVLVAALHLLNVLVGEGGFYSLTLGAMAACWQVYWLNSKNVERVFGTKGWGWS